VPQVTPDFTFANGATADGDQVQDVLSEIVAAVNGLDGENLSTALAEYLGISKSGSPRRGKTIIATEEARTDTAYGLMTTPDRVSGIVLPTDGVLLVTYHAMWKNSVGSAGRAAVFLGANQAKYGASNGGAPAVAEATGHGATGYDWLATVSTGPVLGTVNSANAVTGGITTGMSMIGTAALFAAAGTYDVSVQFKATSGSVTVKERRLYVAAVGY
jgi:hypothetical protein